MAVFIIRETTKKLFRTELFRKSLQIARISEQQQSIIGKREIVGYGINGQPGYIDRPDFPFPAIRWKETTSETKALREKEKGDWSELTCEEKKALYRTSFCQTYSEFRRSNEGEWKSVTAHVIFLVVPALWLYYFFKMTVYKWSGKPESFSQENRECQLRRILDLQMNPITGISSKWDYQRDNWK